MEVLKIKSFLFVMMGIAVLYVTSVSAVKGSQVLRNNARYIHKKKQHKKKHIKRIRSVIGCPAPDISENPIKMVSK